MTETDQDRKAGAETTSTSHPRPEPVIKAPQRKPRETASMPSISSKLSVKVRAAANRATEGPGL